MRTFLPRWAEWVLIRLVGWIDCIDEIEVHHADGRQTAFFKRATDAEVKRHLAQQALERAWRASSPEGPGSHPD